MGLIRKVASRYRVHVQLGREIQLHVLRSPQSSVLHNSVDVKACNHMLHLGLDVARFAMKGVGFL